DDGSGGGFVADEVGRAVRAACDIGMAAVVVRGALAAIQSVRVQAIGARAVVEATIVAMRHVREQIRLVAGLLAFAHLSGRIGLPREGGRGEQAGKKEQSS